MHKVATIIFALLLCVTNSAYAERCPKDAVIKPTSKLTAREYVRMIRMIDRIYDRAWENISHHITPYIADSDKETLLQKRLKPGIVILTSTVEHPCSIEIPDLQKRYEEISDQTSTPRINKGIVWHSKIAHMLILYHLKEKELCQSTIVPLFICTWKDNPNFVLMREQNTIERLLDQG